MTEPLQQPASPHRHVGETARDELPQQLDLGGLRGEPVTVPLSTSWRSQETMESFPPVAEFESQTDSLTQSNPEVLVRRPWPFGLVAIGLTVVLLALQIIAVSLAASGSFASATVIGEILAGATVLPLVFGVLAIIRDRGRGLGIAAVIVSILTNPLVLIAVLDFFGSL